MDTKSNESDFPLICTTAVRSYSRKVEATPERLSKAGTVVRVGEKSKYYDTAPKEKGVVLGTKPGEEGWVYVQFSSYKNRFRVGNPSLDDGVCDLELDEREDEHFATAAFGGQLMEFPFSGFTVQAGDTLKISRKTMKVVGIEPPVPSGVIAFVAEIVSQDLVIVDCQGGRKTVFAGKFAGKLEQSGRVVLDSSGSVVIENYGLEDDSFTLDEVGKITWDDICGQEEAKNRLRDTLERPAQYPKHYAFFGEETSSGFLFYGPPGCSKTMFGKAVYSSIIATCKAKGVKSSQGFFLISGPEVLDKYVGVSEAAIRHVFARARKFYQLTGIRPIIFIDECEAILAKRNSGISSDVLRTIVPAFIAEMQGVRESKAIVILATNKPEILDYAAIREGRIDAKIYIGRPDKKAARAIFLKHMANSAVSDTTTLEKLADVGVEKLFSADLGIYEIERFDGDTKKKIVFTLAHIVSGAMIPAIVKEAKRLALERELAKPIPTEGLREENMIDGVLSIYRQNFASDHGETLREFTKDFAESVREIRKLTQVQR